MSQDKNQPTVHQALSRIAKQTDDTLNLAEAALWLAKWAEPDLKLDAYRRHLDTLVQDTRVYIANDMDDDDIVLEAAHQIVARRYGYAGALDPAERAESANMARTIDHRRGGALILSILYRHVLQAFKRTVEIINFPPRALIAVHNTGQRTKEGRTVLDPFDGGKVLSARDLRRLIKKHHGDKGELAPEHLSPLRPHQVLLSLQHDIKAHHLRHGAPEAALLAIEGALLVAPNEASLWRELGLLHARLDHLFDAAEALEHFLQLPGGDAHRYTASQMLQQLRRRIERGET